MTGKAAEGPEVRGPGLQTWLLERALRKHHLLADDDHIIEWRQGRMTRLRINGVDQPLVSLRELQPVSRAGMSSLSYSATSLFCTGRRMRAADLGRVHRLEGIGHDSLCVIYSAAPSRVVSVQWRTGEPGEHDAELAALISRILEQRDGRLSLLSLQEREHVARERADLAAFGLIESEFTQISVRAGRRRGATDGLLAEPVTVVGRWLRAVMLGDAEARDRLVGQLNRGEPGWNRDEAGVMQAACDLAVGRYFGAGNDPAAVTDLVSFLRQAAQAGSKDRYSQREMEAVIRHALGDVDVDVSGISAQVAYEIQGSVTVIIARQLAWPPPQIDALLAAAEQIALNRGWDPPAG